MTSKDVKTILKEAREAIKNKSYSIAITKCNRIMKADPENYMALLLLGAAYQETDRKEAAKYLKKAEKVSKEPPIVALQGLLNCVEDEEMPENLGKLLELVPEKYPDYHAKLLNLSGKLANIEKILKIFEIEVNNDDAKRKTSAFYCLMKIYMMENSPEAFNELFERTLDFCLQDENVEQSCKHDLFKKYLKLLHSLKYYIKLLDRAGEMSEKYSNDIFPLEWICKVYAENHENKELFNDILYVKMEQALKVNPNSTLILVANGIKLFYDQNYLQAREMLLKVNSYQPNWNICLNILVQIQMKLRAYVLAEGIFRQLKTTKNEDFICCLVSQKKEEKLEEAQKIAEIYPKLRATIEKFNVKESNLEKLQNLPENADNLLEIAEIYFQNADYENSLVNSLKSAKLEPYNSECFFWLGKIYLQSNDELRAKKCLEKCLNLYPCKEEALVMLSIIYRKNAEWESNLRMLENSAKSLFGQNSSNLAWTHLQLGLHHLAVLNYDEAISAFRSVIRYDVRNITSWEGLADAYMARGSYSSALKVFEKIAEFEPQNPYPKLQMGNIKIILHHYTDAIAVFDQLLTEFKDYFPILKGIAEAHFMSCQWRLSQRLIGRAREHAQKAVDYLTEAIKVKPHFQCLWKLLANSMTTVAKFPSNKCYLMVKGELAANSDRKLVKLQGDELYDLAVKCYHRMIRLSKTDSSESHFYWYEISLAYYNRAKTFFKTKDQTDKRRELLKLAYESAKNAVKLSSGRWHNWNLLGVIAATEDLKMFGLAQHCFIKAIQLDRKTTAICWSNLGVLYLINGQTTLANKAFSRSQQTDTTFINAWIGQGIIAEQIGQGDEAMDLFRHSTQLAYHPESSIGYPHWVCSVLDEKDYTKDKKLLYAIEHMNAVALALDSINWHCIDKNGDCSVEALCFLANLSFSQGHFKLAVEALQKATKKELTAEIKDKIYCDMGYCLLKCGKPELAIEAFNQVSKATYNSTVGKALAYFKASQFEESYAVYETVLNWLATSDLDKAYVLLAMSAMIYAFQGDSDAKTILFQCISLPNPALEALYSACALGLLHGDSQLTELVINELQKHERDDKNGHHVAYLISQFYLSKGQAKTSYLYLLGQLHKYPNRSKLRKIITKHLLKMDKITEKQSIFASRIVQSSMVLALKSGDKKEKVTGEDAAKSLAIASQAMKNVDRKQQRLLAQKAVHANPVCKEAWLSLIACQK